MSKAVSKFDKKNHLSVQKMSNPVPSLREVNVPAIKVDNSDSQNIVTAYKDLNQPLLDLAANQQRNLFIAFGVFVILGLGILMGQYFNKSRVVASADMARLVPASASLTDAEHYHYDKSCYTGENGEKICMTRTSQKR